MRRNAFGKTAPRSAHYGALIDGFQQKYDVKVNELSPDAGSADQLQAIRDNKDGGPAAPDVIDVGFAFAEQAKRQAVDAIPVFG